MRLVPLLDIGFYTMLRREIQLKCELYNENFQNYKSYNIPKAQLIIADIPYNIGKNFYGSNPSWYVGGNRENGESKLAGKAAFNTDFSFNITEFFHFVSRMLKPDPKKKTEGNEPPCILVFCSYGRRESQLCGHGGCRCCAGGCQSSPSQCLLHRAVYDSKRKGTD